MTSHGDLKEHTLLIDRYFPINIFRNTSQSHNVLYTHWHENIEIIYITSGNAVFNIGSQTIEAIRGDIIFVNSGLLHSGYSTDNTQVEFYAIVFDKTLLASHSPDPYHIKYITPFLEGQYLFPVKISSTDTRHDFFAGNIENLVAEFIRKNSGYELVIKSYLTLIIISILRYYHTDASADSSSGMYERNVENFKRLISFIEQHFTERITIDQAARIVNLSPFHFCKTFKRITGRTFIEFLNLYRVNQAEELLRGTKIPITDIAEKVGFCNINYFDRIFKQYKRYSPSTCRK